VDVSMDMLPEQSRTRSGLSTRKQGGMAENMDVAGHRGWHQFKIYSRVIM
jgi:hypothetical protein